MHKQTFNISGLENVIRKSDFRRIARGDPQKVYRRELLLRSVVAAQTKFSAPNNPLSSFSLNGDVVFRFEQHHDRLVERRLTSNLCQAFGRYVPSRTSVIENLKLLLCEGTALRLYRLDIKKFYESFQKNEIIEKIGRNPRLSPQSKLLVSRILDCHESMRGCGLPRGLTVSATLAEILMRDFDIKFVGNNYVFYYYRYVDDIILITSGEEKSGEFMGELTRSLPQGLSLNNKKLKISSAIGSLPSGVLVGKLNKIFRFDYLGYQFIISNHPKKHQLKEYRNVDIDVADKKSDRYKFRMSRAFYRFVKDEDFGLLNDRIRYLTNNFRVFDIHSGKTKMVGIYHNYPSIQGEMKNLKGLDYYLNGIVNSGRGRIGGLIAQRLTSSMKKTITKNSFTYGHLQKRFVHFSAQRIAQIKECWEH